MYNVSWDGKWSDFMIDSNMTIWRKANMAEREKIKANAKAAFGKKIMNAIGYGGVAEFVTIMIAILLSLQTIEGRTRSYNVRQDLLFFGFFTVIDIAICFAYLWPSKKRFKLLEEQAFLVTEGKVTDRKEIIGRSMDAGSYETVELGSEDEPESREFKVVDDYYDDMKLGTEVLLVSYSEDESVYGFFDTYDVVVK